MHAAGPAARRLVLEAALLSPDEAVAAGLVDRVTAPGSLLDEAIAEAERLGKIPADVYAYTKRQLQAPARALIDAISPADDEAPPSDGEQDMKLFEDFDEKDW